MEKIILKKFFNMKSKNTALKIQRKFIVWKNLP